MRHMLLILLLVVMAGINILLDFLSSSSLSDIQVTAISIMLVVSIATAAPAGMAAFIASKTRFQLLGINIYRLSANFILGLSLTAWSYLLFIRERPDYYEGASHMYIIAWPALLGFLAIALYLSCVIIQLFSWMYQMHKSVR